MVVKQSETRYARVMRQMQNEDGVEYTAFGIMAQPPVGEGEPLVIEDISSYPERVDVMVELFNAQHLSIEHFYDAVNDLIVD